jgi:hypothetical protein
LAIPDPNLIATDLIAQIQSFGFRGARQDVHPDDHDLVTEMLRSYRLQPDFFPIFLLCGGTMQRSDGQPWEPQGILDHARDVATKLRDLGFKDRELALEVGNEPDLAHKRWKKNPEELGKLYKECIGIVKSFSASWHCLSPSISNLDEDSLDYLDRMALPVGAEVAFHRYPPGKDFWSAHRGFKGRTGEVDALKKIANGAPLWHTEGGWAELNRDYTLTELEVAERMADEVRFWGDAGVGSLTLYQLNSCAWKAGDSDEFKRLATYGARRADGSWKPWAAAVKEARV